ncbi:MAG: hypothetical protein IK070_03275 [Clostridia bacterium]|nr:hypothetical protein [Clostridia bacterium]
MSYVIPIMIIALFLYAFYKKVNMYDSFVFGGKSACKLVVTTLPYIVAVFIMIEIFSASGLNTILANTLQPLFNVLGIPNEVTGLILIKPFSGSGSIAVLEQIICTHGPNSYITRCACAIVGSSEAIFFVSSVYFAKTKVKKFGLLIVIALLSNFVAAVVACNICKII